MTGIPQRKSKKAFAMALFIFFTIFVLSHRYTLLTFIKVSESIMVQSSSQLRLVALLIGWVATSVTALSYNKPLASPPFLSDF